MESLFFPLIIIGIIVSIVSKIKKAQEQQSTDTSKKQTPMYQRQEPRSVQTGGVPYRVYEQANTVNNMDPQARQPLQKPVINANPNIEMEMDRSSGPGQLHTHPVEMKVLMDKKPVRENSMGMDYANEGCEERFNAIAPDTSLKPLAQVHRLTPTHIRTAFIYTQILGRPGGRRTSI